MENRNIKAEYKAKRKTQIILGILLAPIGILVLYAENTPSMTLFNLDATYSGLIIIFLVLFALGFSYFNWRCPSCKKGLGRSLNYPSCPHCNIDFE